MRCEICGRDADDRSQHHPQCISYLPTAGHLGCELEAENTRLKNRLKFLEKHTSDGRIKLQEENTKLKELNQELLRVAQNRISALEELVWLYKGFLVTFREGRQSKLWIRIHENEEKSRKTWKKY